jgi:hypothetical protein
VKIIVASTSCLTLLLLAVAVCGTSPAAAATPLRPLETAIVDPAVFTGPDAAAGILRTAAAGATAIKVPMFWDTIAPAEKPSDFRATDPSDPRYYWTQLDTQLRLIQARGLEPIVYIAARPAWALRTIDGHLRPDPGHYRRFALAAVRRYSGNVRGVPRVRYWQAWNEPNKVGKRDQKASAANWYRALVNAFAASVHSRAGNLVVAGGLSPFGISTAVAPLAFMRSLLCVSPGRSPRRTCAAKIHFDVWATHPYTAGAPTHEAYRANDVSLGDLPEMKGVLDAAVRLGQIVSKHPVRFWVTEFSWDSNPPDPAGVPAKLEGRWVAEGLYRMWSAGVSLVTWYTLRDQPIGTSPYQSGLYFRGSSFSRDRPKPALTAFRFPFVAFDRSSKVFVWGRTPSGAAASVVVEQQGSSGWRRVALLRADGAGIFTATVSTSGRGPLRARLPGTGSSLAFSLVKTRDRIYQPFGR